MKEEGYDVRRMLKEERVKVKKIEGEVEKRDEVV